MSTRSSAAKPAAERTVMEDEQGEGVMEKTGEYVFITPEIFGEPSDPSPNPSAITNELGDKKINTIKIRISIFDKKVNGKNFFISEKNKEYFLRYKRGKVKV